MPNVNSLVEMMDMREAQRSYEANLNMIEALEEHDVENDRLTALVNDDGEQIDGY